MDYFLFSPAFCVREYRALFLPILTSVAATGTRPVAKQGEFRATALCSGADPAGREGDGMTGGLTIRAGIGLILLAGLLVAERRRSGTGLWIFKPLTAAVYVWIALTEGATESGYGVAVLIALLLSWCGDVLLIPQDRPAIFRAGVLAFLAAHIAFVVAFLVRGVDWQAFLVAALVIAVPGAVVWRWIRGRIPVELAAAVRIYIVVITLMFAAAIGSHAESPALTIAVGAGFFWVSDLFVARDRFIQAGFINRLLGLPLYFVAQLLLALSVAIS